jgi:hypothetical protein
VESDLMRQSASLLENLIQQNYSRTDLPPLWEVIYQEALRGHHLLFKRSDVEDFESSLSSNQNFDHNLYESLEEIVVSLVSSNDLNTMVRIIDSLPRAERRNLYLFYQRTVWLWRNYSKESLN